MTKNNRLSGSSSWIDLEFVERERTPQHAIEVGIQLHLAGLPLSNTKQALEKLGVERSRTAIHNWVQKADLQPTSDTVPNQIAVDETVIRVNGEQYWLYAAVNPATNEFLHVRLFQTLTTQLTLLFLRELREKQQVEQATFLVDGAHHLQTALTRLGLRFQYVRHGNRNSVERVFREVKRRTSSFANAFRNAELETAESWLQAFAVWHNSCQT
jgi:putative transposase